MHVLRIIGLILCIGFQTAMAQQNNWQQQVDYQITTRLDPADHSLQSFARIRYINHSPDTLRFIWFHLWPNAFKNDRTAFSDQLLENDRTDFYFSSQDERGYINRLDFRINDKPVATADHPEHSDIIKLILPSALLPGDSVHITTPFHVKLPFNFSRGGHQGLAYQVTQWYPKAAVYDRQGWHPMPYLDQGEFYADFGTYEVSITVPEKFVVAATGEPRTPVEEVFFMAKKAPKKKPGAKTVPPPPRDWQQVPLKTYTYRQDRAIDFAWFADSAFSVQKGTVTLPSGKQVQLRCYFHLSNMEVWANAISYMKDAILLHSQWIGEYPYSSATIVDGPQGGDGGMEYPTITLLTGPASPRDLDLLIFHEIGHNWFQATLATNERRFPWMDEGMNTYYDHRYEALKYPLRQSSKRGLNSIMDDPRAPELLVRTQVRLRKDQPIATAADSLSKDNYSLIAYEKTAIWMKKLETLMGQQRFDQAMQSYYTQWSFRHPYPEDFRRVIQDHSPAVTDTVFDQLYTQGNINPEPKRPIRIVPLYQLRKTYDSRPIFVMPIVAYNAFNGLMPGLAFHNYSLPLPRFNFIMAPMFGIRSKKLNGWSRLAYHWYPKEGFSHVELSGIFASFNQELFRDSAGQRFNLGTSKVAPSLKLTFRQASARSSMERFLQLRFYRIAEDEINFLVDPITGKDVVDKIKNRYNIGQARFVANNQRKLYPYRGEVLAEVNKEFMRINVIGNYFFNFRKKGGVNLRIYAGKFMYLVTRSTVNQFNLQRYHLTMTGPNGYEDYTYSSPFIGRNEGSGVWTQQIMQRDGYFKVRTDLLANKVGVSDNWLTTANLTMDVPDRLNPLSVLPIKIPLKLFADIGASGSTWNQDVTGSRLLYDGGIQLSMLNNTVNFYFPLVYSRVYRDYFKSTPGNSFLQRMSFSIHVQDLTFKQIREKFAR